MLKKRFKRSLVERGISDKDKLELIMKLLEKNGDDSRYIRYQLKKDYDIIMFLIFQ